MKYSLKKRNLSQNNYTEKDIEIMVGIKLEIPHFLS